LGEGELGPHLTQCGQGRDLPACQVSSWSVQPFGHNTPTLQTDRQTDWTDRQRTDSIGRTILQTVARKWLNRSICHFGSQLWWAERSTCSIVVVRWHQCAFTGEHIGATWRIRLNRPSVAAMRPYVKVLWPLVIKPMELDTTVTAYVSVNVSVCLSVTRMLKRLIYSRLTWFARDYRPEARHLLVIAKFCVVTATINTGLKRLLD